MCGLIISLCVIWGTTINERHETIREHPKEGYNDGEGSEGKVCEERLRPLGVLSAEQRS